MRHKQEWAYGDKSRVAHAAGISPQFFCDIYKNRSRCSPELAIRLEQACDRYGYHISRSMWVFEDLRFGHHLFPPVASRRGR